MFAEKKDTQKRLMNIEKNVRILTLISFLDEEHNRAHDE
jgi:hypothetical protein